MFTGVKYHRNAVAVGSLQQRSQTPCIQLDLRGAFRWEGKGKQEERRR